MTVRIASSLSRTLWGVVILAACRADEVVSPINPNVQQYWALQLDRSAITLALAADYDTLHLQARPVTPSGVPIEGLPAPTFRSTNVNTVIVDATGQITALDLTAGTQIITSLTADGVTHTDTALVAVTAAPAPVTSFSIHPVPPDSARFALRGTLLQSFHPLTPIVLDAGGIPLSGVPVRYQSLDRRTALVDSWAGTVQGLRLGYVDLAAATTVYGQTFTDTLSFRIGYPGYVKVKVYGPFYGFVPYQPGTFVPDSVVIGTGGVVEWENTGMLEGTLMDMVFEPAAAATLDSVPEQYVCVNYSVDCGSTGNVAPFGPPINLPDGSNFEDYFRNLSRARRFTQPGVYRYRNTQWNTEGVIVVIDETAP
jgi:hypothetical protein